MTQILRKDTAVDVLIGPFVDITDGATSENGETPTVKLSKNGQALGAKSDVTVPVNDADGYYNCELDATDTDTAGTLILTVAASATALPVRHEFQVVEEATYDFLFASGATPLADMNAEMVDVMTVDTLTATPQAAPPTTPTFEEAVMALYDALVHKVKVDATSKEFSNNAGTVIWKKALSDDGTDYIEAESASGP